ncbi:hypothetical protein GCM10010156_73340 [Planobispora rosea]|uniref:Uncharacterized protein n=1 Tax=Planobispora rosea TaxID=35762 RepID=A0A8J3SFU2_PLARO|nr:hypothetical protein [Planobispora rosea]GGT04892.1 hypothetical protein GCM10010156_73340 [Planobispora rosea]GIH88918.1 hypothetical protein Pro02_73260 [Planobispora rosea]
MTGRFSTHGVVFDGDVVIKTYASWDRGEPRREWELLTLLNEHAPDLAAVPVRAELTALPPRVVMSRLDGVPLRGRVLTGGQVGALARAVTRLRTAIPASVLAMVPPAPGGGGTAAAPAKAHAQTARPPDCGAGGVLASARRGGCWSCWAETP